MLVRSKNAEGAGSICLDYLKHTALIGLNCRLGLYLMSGLRLS